jgi:transposase
MNENNLYDLYILENKSGLEIKDIMKCSSATIYNYLRKYKIKTRGNEEAQKKVKVDIEKMIDLYVNKKYSCRKISKEFSCGDESIRKLLKKYNVELRKKTENFGGWNKSKKTSVSVKQKISRTRKKLYLLGELKHWNLGGKWDLKTRLKISKKLKGKNKGESNPNWNGGHSSEYKKWRRLNEGNIEYREFRKEIYERDGYSCVFCGKKSNGDLQLHHIKTVKNYPHLFMEKTNCVTLCKKCHCFIRNKEEEYEQQIREKLYCYSQ